MVSHRVQGWRKFFNSESKADELKDIPEDIKGRMTDYLRNSESLRKANHGHHFRLCWSACVLHKSAFPFLSCFLLCGV